MTSPSNRLRFVNGGNGVAQPEKKIILPGAPSGAGGGEQFAPGKIAIPLQQAASAMVAQLATMPSFDDELQRMEDWKRDHPDEVLTAGQRVSLRTVRLVARWQRQARELVEAAKRAAARDAE